MPSCSQACKVPVRPMPHLTSSRISSTPWRAEFQDLALKRIGGAAAIVLFRFTRLLEAIGEAGLDVVGLDQQRRELRPAPGIAAGGERTQRIAVIALAAGDDVAPLGLAALGEVL